MFELFVLLVLGHLVADYVFQTDSIALGKNNTLDPAKFGNQLVLLDGKPCCNTQLICLCFDNEHLGLFV